MDDDEIIAERHRTRALLDDELRQRLDVQRTAAERVETKANIVLGFSIAAGQFVLRSEASSAWLAPSVAAFALSIAASLYVLTVRRHEEINPTTLVPDLWNATTAEAHQALIEARLWALEENRGRLRWRRRGWWVSFWSLTLAGILAAAHLHWGS